MRDGKSGPSSSTAHLLSSHGRALGRMECLKKPRATSASNSWLRRSWPALRSTRQCRLAARASRRVHESSRIATGSPDRPRRPMTTADGAQAAGEWGALLSSARARCASSIVHKCVRAKQFCVGMRTSPWRPRVVQATRRRHQPFWMLAATDRVRPDVRHPAEHRGASANWRDIARPRMFRSGYTRLSLCKFLNTKNVAHD